MSKTKTLSKVKKNSKVLKNSKKKSVIKKKKIIKKTINKTNVLKKELKNVKTKILKKPKFLKLIRTLCK